MTVNSSSPNQKPTSTSSPSRNLILRTMIVTTLVFSTFFIASVLVFYLFAPPRKMWFNMAPVFAPEIIGFLMGFLVIWWVFPQSSFPKSLKVTSPKLFWAFKCWWTLSPLFLLLALGFIPFEFFPSQLWIGLMLTPAVAYMTYQIFFSVLWYGGPFKYLTLFK